MTVSYVTGGIDLEDPFADREVNGLEIELDEKYPLMIKSFSVPEHPPPPSPKPLPLTTGWFRDLKNSRPILPESIQVPLPLRVVSTLTPDEKTSF